MLFASYFPCTVYFLTDDCRWFGQVFIRVNQYQLFWVAQSVYYTWMLTQLLAMFHVQWTWTWPIMMLINTRQNFFFFLLSLFFCRLIFRFTTIFPGNIIHIYNIYIDMTLTPFSNTWISSIIYIVLNRFESYFICIYILVFQ